MSRLCCPTSGSGSPVYAAMLTCLPFWLSRFGPLLSGHVMDKDILVSEDAGGLSNL